MTIESGFSVMKLQESVYQNNLSKDNYNYPRLIPNHVDRENFERFLISKRLNDLLKHAGSKYRKVMAKSSKENRQKALDAKEM